jgi:hypothetical protein
MNLLELLLYYPDISVLIMKHLSDKDFRSVLQLDPRIKEAIMDNKYLFYIRVRKKIEDSILNIR